MIVGQANGVGVANCSRVLRHSWGRQMKLTARKALRQVTRQDFLEAIRVLKREGIPDGYGPSTGYDLLHEDSRYPPRAVAALAVRRLLGRLPEQGEFMSGLGSSCFKA